MKDFSRRRKGNAMGRHDIEIPDHVANFLLRVAISNVPTNVLETLAKMSPDEIAVLERVRASFEEVH